MTVAGASPSSPNPEIDHEDDYIDVEAGPTNDHAVAADEPARKLSPRQIWMITCGGITGIGLVFSTSKTLAGTSPATMLIGYVSVGALVFLTLLSLGACVPMTGSRTRD